MQLTEKLKKNWGFLFIAIFIFVTLIYVLVRRDGIYIQIHDYLDCHPAWAKMMSDNGLFWKTDVQVPMLGGIDRNYLYSDLKAYIWIFMILPTFPAIITGWYAKIFLSVAGFMFLAGVIYDKSEKDKNLIALCGFVYGIIPSYPPDAFGFASLPFLMGILILLYQRFDWRYVAALLIYPVFSDFATFGVFICGYILLFFIMNWMIKRKPAWRILPGLATVSMGYVISEWRLFYTMFFSGDVTIRTASARSHAGLSEALKQATEVFRHGHYHSDTLHAYVILPTCLIYLIYINVKYIRDHNAKTIVRDKLNWLMIWIVLNCLIYGLDKWEAFRSLIATVVPVLGGFSFARTLWLNPFLWYFSFMIILCRVTKRAMAYILLFLAFGTICFKNATYNHIYQNLQAIVYEWKNGTEYPDLTYGEFYSERLFDKIKEDIDYNGEWSVAFGMHPAVIEYNGIATLDGYVSMYPVEYKQQFRMLIAPELERDEVNANYFDSWGGRAYILSDEVAFDMGRKTEPDEARLYIDSEVFREMGGTYVFSRVSVINASELGLEETGVYTDESSPYRIYVYRVVE